jgi:hypothetical protein
MQQPHSLVIVLIARLFALYEKAITHQRNQNIINAYAVRPELPESVKMRVQSYSPSLFHDKIFRRLIFTFLFITPKGGIYNFG